MNESNKSYLTEAKELVNEIGASRELTSNTDVNDIFLSAEKIIGLLAYLIKPLADLEQEYRKEALPIIITRPLMKDGVTLIQERESQSAAEARAKAGEIYKEWRKLDNLMKLSHEQLLILKKFRDDLSAEFKIT